MDTIIKILVISLVILIFIGFFYGGFGELILKMMRFCIGKLSEKKSNKASDLIVYGAYEEKQFMTNNERNFFLKLNKSVKPCEYVFSQVRLVDIVQVSTTFKNDRIKYNSLFRKISQWHCDFIITDANFNIKAAIELDDSSHNRKDRIKRDRYFNVVMRQAKIPLYRVRDYKELMESGFFINSN